MKTSKSILRTLFSVLLLTVSIVTVQAEPAILQFAFDNTGVVLAASPLVTVFTKDIQENLFPDNEFYKNSKDDSMWLDGRYVRLPQAGAIPNVERNRTTLPAQINKRNDDAEEYEVDEFTTDPILIQDTEEMQLSYAKRQSVLYDHTNTLNTNVADNFGQIWMPTLGSNFVRTTGGTTVATAPGASGNRKLIQYADWVDAVTLLDRMDVPQADRFACVPASIYGQMLKIDQFIDYQKRGLVDLIKKGIVGEILGIQIYKRSRLALYDNTGTPVKKAFGAAAASSDNEAVLIWQKNMVRRAEGAAKVYSDLEKPEYYGSVFSAKVNCGGRIARTDQKGVVALIQAHA
jgi:hypothetical protein